MTTIFSYYLVPNFLFPSVTALSIACWIWKNFVTTQQIGLGLKGLGIGSFSLNWVVVSSYLWIPLATPWFAIANVMVGFMIIMYVIIPISYWTNIYNAKALSCRFVSCAHWILQVLDSHGYLLISLSHGLWPSMILLAEFLYWQTSLLKCCRWEISVAASFRSSVIAI